MPDALKTSFNRWDSLAIIIGIVVGVGIFRVPDEVTRYLDSPWMILSAWLVGGLISFIGVLCFAELSSAFPQTGGSYIYLRESFGSATGFLFGWAQLVVIRTGSIAAVAFIFAEYTQSFFSLSNSLVKPLAVLSVFILSAMNGLGVVWGKRAQNFLSAAKIAFLCLLIIFGFLSHKGSFVHFNHLPDFSDKGLFTLFGLALIPILWTYGGWEENTYLAGETIKPGKTLPFTLIAGIAIVTALYLLLQCLYLYLLPKEQLTNNVLIAPYAINVILGKWGKIILEALVILFSLGAINGMIITGSRVTYAMGQDHVIFSYLGQINPRLGTPLRSIIINGLWTCILIISGAFSQLLFFTGVIVWCFFCLNAIGLFVLRRKYPDIKRPYRTWGYPFVPAVFVLICFALVINTVVSFPVESIMGLLLTASGIPIYYFSRIQLKDRGA